jgi:phosphatidylinositol alpha-1,6-mannosyltransferase
MTGATRRLRLLYIARAYPPTVGGMENFAYQLRTHLARYADVVPLINHGGKRALPAFLPYATARGIALTRRQRIDAVHLADALLAPVGAAVKAVTGAPVSVSVCGLDVTYPNRAYQAVVPRALARLDLALPISRATERELSARTAGRLRARVITLGVNEIARPGDADVERFRRLAQAAPDERIIFGCGRLVERKGFAWFVAEVMPRLSGDVIFVVAGDGPERESIARAAAAAGVGGRVRLLGRVDDGALAAGYASADVFVMPNVPRSGDIEGFGLVALEASSSGVPVVASRLEGIADAVQDRRNGLLAAAGDATEWAAAIRDLLALQDNLRRALGARYAEVTRAEYGWDRVAAAYADEISALIDERTSQREAA